MMLHLDTAPKRWFMRNLRRYFPHLEPLYASLYPGETRYVDYSVSDELSARARTLRETVGSPRESLPVLRPPPPPVQLALGNL